MTLGDCIREYREAHDLSQRQFAELCGLSNAYISILEKNVNPKNGEPPVPTYGAYKAVADALGITVQSLMEKATESAVSMGAGKTIETMTQQWHPDVLKILERSLEHSDEDELLSLFRSMTDTDKDKLLDYARFIVDSYKRPDKRRKE